MTPSLVTSIVKSPFVRNVGKLAGASAMTQVITLACAPILTRLYTPDDFGLLGVFLAITVVATAVSTLRYDLAIMLPKEDSSAWALLMLAAKWSVVAVGVVFLLLYPFREHLADRLGANELGRYFVWLPLLVLSGGWLSLASSWAVRKKAFGALSLSSLGSSIVGNSIKICGGFLALGGGFLILSAFIQQFLQLVFVAGSLKDKLPDGKANPDEAWKMVKEHADFPIYRMPQDAMASLASNLPNIFLAAYYSPVIVGYYLLAYRMTIAPISLIRESVRKVYYQKATELSHAGDNLQRSVIQATLTLALLCMPIVLMLGFWGEGLFVLVFGDEWAISGIYAKYIGILVLLSVMNTPSVVVVPILKKNRGLLFYEVFGTGVRIASIVVGGMYLSAESTIALFCYASAFANACLITWVLLSLKRTEG